LEWPRYPCTRPRSLHEEWEPRSTVKATHHWCGGRRVIDTNAPSVGCNLGIHTAWRFLPCLAFLSVLMVPSDVLRKGTRAGCLVNGGNRAHNVSSLRRCSLQGYLAQKKGPYRRPMPRILGWSEGGERVHMGEVPLYGLTPPKGRALEATEIYHYGSQEDRTTA